MEKRAMGPPAFFQGPLYPRVRKGEEEKGEAGSFPWFFFSFTYLSRATGDIFFCSFGFLRGKGKRQKPEKEAHFLLLLFHTTQALSLLSSLLLSSLRRALFFYQVSRLSQ